MSDNDPQEHGSFHCALYAWVESSAFRGTPEKDRVVDARSGALRRYCRSLRRHRRGLDTIVVV